MKEVIIAVVASGGLWAVVLRIIEEFLTDRKKVRIEHEALGALLRHDMFEIYDIYRDADEVPKDVQEEMDGLWMAYHGLGFNHLGDVIHEKIMAKNTAKGR